MDIDEDMVLLVVKEQLANFRVKKVIDDECKNLLTWWRTQDKHFSYVKFVARQILEIVGLHIEAEKIFNITYIYMSLHCSRLGTKNLEMLINIYKNWPEYARVASSLSMKKFMEMEET
jgi:hypothetical protein